MEIKNPVTMNMTPNQTYRKERKNGVSFKEWLQIQKEKGNFLTEDDSSNFTNDENYSNITKQEENLVKVEQNNDVEKTNLKIRNNNIFGFVAVSILIFGIYQISKRTIVETND